MLQEILNFFSTPDDLSQISVQRMQKILKDRDFENKVSSNCQSRDVPIEGNSHNLMIKVF